MHKEEEKRRTPLKSKETSHKRKEWYFKKNQFNVRNPNSKDRLGLCKTLLLGSLASLLYEIKCLAQITATTRNTRVEKESVTLLSLYHYRFGIQLREIIGVFIYDTFKSLRVSNLDLLK